MSASYTPPRWPHVELPSNRPGQLRASWTWADKPQPELPTPPWRYLWHVFPGRHWPWLADEERDVISQLGPPDTSQPPARGTYTVLLNMLRCGTVPRLVLQVTPGISTGHLHAAYLNLQRRLDVATDAWRRIVHDPTVGTLQANAALAAPLMGVPMRRLAPPMDVIDDGLIARRMQLATAEIDNATQRVAEVEEALAHFAPPSAAGVELGRLLHDPRKPALWSDPHFLADRVGALSAARVTGLLRSAAITKEIAQ